MSTWWGNFNNWLESPQGWIFYPLLLGVILWILYNLVVFFRRSSEYSAPFSTLGPEERWTLIFQHFARILATAGGFIVLISAPLSGSLFLASFGLPGIGLLVFGLFVYLLGLFWLTWLAAPRRVRAILGAIWGSLAFLLSSLEAAATVSATTRDGAYFTIVGSLLLVCGSALVYLKATEARRGSVPFARPVPPSP